MLHTVKDHKYINSYADYLGYPDATILNGGKAIAKTGKKLLGVKTPKGSRAAKIKMAYLRSLRGGAFADDLQEALRRRRRFIADEDEIPEAEAESARIVHERALHIQSRKRQDHIRFGDKDISLQSGFPEKRCP